MKEINRVIYEASDGEQFETREKCEQHELALRITEVKKFNYDLELTSYDYSDYLVIRNEEEAKIIDAFCKEFDLTSPWEDSNIPMSYRGFLYFDDDGYWRPFSDKICEIKQLYVKLKNVADYQPENEIEW